jgi:hypothetical protein
VNLQIDFIFDAEKTKVLTSGFNSYSFETGGKRSVGGCCYGEPRVMEMLVLGEDLKFDIKCSFSSYQVVEREVVLKPYFSEYIRKICPENKENGIFSDQRHAGRLYSLYAEALDKGFTPNNG